MIKVLSVIVTILILWMNAEIYISRDIFKTTKSEVITVSIMDILMIFLLIIIFK
ncbi:hypothetical protein [Clostridium perfringens]|uniref:hypothetical protein n=1 Tax=Clostridium perfringens TaxID=1502 RepID=UPI00158C2020|nr:hypothetical protein [Clostridium perfringens]